MCKKIKYPIIALLKSEQYLFLQKSYDVNCIKKVIKIDLDCSLYYLAKKKGIRMIKKLISAVLLCSNIILSSDKENNALIWKNGIGRFEDKEIIYYAQKNDEIWMTQYVKDIKDNYFFARSVSVKGVTLGVRLHPESVREHFEKLEMLFAKSG